MGCRYTDPNTKQLTFSQVFPASTVASDAMAFVVDDPNVLFTIQADGSFTNTRDIYGKNCTLITTAVIGTSFPILVCKFNYHQLSAAAGAA